MSPESPPAVADGISPLIFERSRPGRRAWSLPALDVPAAPGGAIPAALRRRAAPRLPEVSERDLVAHYTRLSRRNYGVDAGFYPLGSCTMKYNPKLAEDAAALPGFRRVHPLQPESQVQGALQLLVELEAALREITGMAAVTFQPAAGAHGELTGLLMMRAWHESRGDSRRRVIIPDSAHGTNPASVRLAGYEVAEVPSDSRGLVDIPALERLAGPDVAGLMITNPNTLGLFEQNIESVARIVHAAGGLLYYDGANFNAIIGHCRPGDMGFDIVHLNLHKTFATPHGGGGPGSGPLAVSERLAPFLPGPRPALDPSSGRYHWAPVGERSIGRVHTFGGNFGVVVRASAYVRALGPEGLRRVSEMAVLNANYLAARLRGTFDLAYPGQPMHEFVLSARRQKARGARAMDIAKRLIDHGVHPPTVYFPLVVEEAMMVEPTETESRETLDAFADAMLAVDREIDSDPEALYLAPHTTPVSRPDEARAARLPILRFTPGE
ncbi:MAG: aminomethyl-transferring glycine dehydrogenase subunit GcvPB [Acidobacteria bacterium]|nr:aminomethyl-transferring glycine dehydrogenase subunit GcvPB [Acidobacteriota bacterium]